MQLYPFLLVVVIVAADAAEVLPLPAATPSGWRAVALGVLPQALLVVTASMLVTLCMRRMSRGGPRVLLSAGRLVAAFRWLVLAWHAVAVLWLGWLAAIRTAIGDLILVDELLCLAPPVVAWSALWWVYYPVERRLREALQVRQLDLGAPIYSLPSRREYTSQQTRCGLLLLLVPVLLIVTASEAIDAAASRWGTEATLPFIDVAKLGGALLVFSLAPFVARAVLTVRPLAPGEVRDTLTEVCRRHRVRIRDILVWQTGGSIINAAVMGLLGRLRYVLLTDALLESMTASQVEAVMAHEVAHVRRHHMPWLIVALMAALTSTWLLISLPFYIVGSVWTPPIVVELGIFGGQLAAALLIFGWVSRRFERQADTFAVQHLSGMGGGAGGDAEVQPTTVQPEAVLAMNGALARIAQLNTIDPRRHSWRHGSIWWRQRYLQSIVSRPVSRLPIDRLVRWIKLTTGLVLAASVATMYVLDGGGGREEQGTETVMEFAKLHGIGNDYLFVDASAYAIEDPPALSRVMSDRHYGVGADGLILVLPPDDGVDAHLRMRMYNADGSEAEMCGNGIRGLCKFAHDRGLCTERPMRVQTGAGVLTLDYTLDPDGRVDEVTVDMGEPVLEPGDIPMALPAAFDGDRVVDAPLDVFFADLADLAVEPMLTCLSMGNPHAVLFCPSLDEIPLATAGRRLECDPVFPNRVNVHFVQRDGPAELTMATWERGSGATLACGTGASAVCVAGAITGRTDRDVLAHLPGGDLRLRWDDATDHVLMTGPAREVFTGRWPSVP
jgi:diaminopimelate epimerase